MPTKRDDSDMVSRTKGEEDNENEQDRKARLRVGAFGAVAWILGKVALVYYFIYLTDLLCLETRHKSSKERTIDDLMDLFCNPALWTSLHHAETSPLADLENFGWNQPVVRKAAWITLQTLLRHWKGALSVRTLKING